MDTNGNEYDITILKSMIGSNLNEFLSKFHDDKEFREKAREILEKSRKK